MKNQHATEQVRPGSVPTSKDQQPGIITTGEQVATRRDEVQNRNRDIKKEERKERVLPRRLRRDRTEHDGSDHLL